MRRACKPGGVCEQCGELIPTSFIRQCPAATGIKSSYKPQPKPVGIGDRLESALTSIGYTQEKHLELLEAIGLPPVCNCDARKEWLNKLGEKIGDKVSAVSAILWPPVPRIKPKDKT